MTYWPFIAYSKNESKILLQVEKAIYFLENVCISTWYVVMKGIKPVIVHWQVVFPALCIFYKHNGDVTP